MHATRIAVAVTLALLVSACAPKKVRLHDEKASTGLVYGRIILPSDDYELGSVMIIKPGKVYVGRIGVPAQVLPDGRFVAENVEPGEYMFGGFQTGQVRHVMGKEALRHKFKLKPGALHYVGTFKYVEVPSPTLFAPPSFDLQQVKTKAAQAELLQWLDESAEGSGWQPRIRKELSRYKRHLPKKTEETAKR